MEVIWELVGIGLGGLLAIYILLKVCSKHYTLNMILLIVAGSGLIVSSFIMPNDPNINAFYICAAAQAIAIFLYVVLLGAEWAFDKEDYWATRGTVDSDGHFDGETKLESRSMFWGTLGVGFGATATLMTLNYAIFRTHAIALGVIGCIVTVWAMYILIRNFVHLHRNNKSYY